MKRNFSGSRRQQKEKKHIRKYSKKGFVLIRDEDIGKGWKEYLNKLLTVENKRNDIGRQKWLKEPNWKMRGSNLSNFIGKCEIWKSKRPAR